MYADSRAARWLHRDRQWRRARAYDVVNDASSQPAPIFGTRSAYDVVQEADALSSKDLTTAVNKKIEYIKKLLECNAQLASRVGQLDQESSDRLMQHAKHPSTSDQC